MIRPSSICLSSSGSFAPTLGAKTVKPGCHLDAPRLLHEAIRNRATTADENDGLRVGRLLHRAYRCTAINRTRSSARASDWSAAARFQSSRTVEILADTKLRWIAMSVAVAMPFYGSHEADGDGVLR
jgi:hypothetical protein